MQTNASADSSETSTKLLECRPILTRSSFTGLDPLSCRLVSLLFRVDCFCPSSLANCPLLSSFVSLSDWRPLTTSGHVEIAGPKPFVWFCAKTDKGIVCLADHLHSVTIELNTQTAEKTYRIFKIIFHIQKREENNGYQIEKKYNMF